MHTGVVRLVCLGCLMGPRLIVLAGAFTYTRVAIMGLRTVTRRGCVVGRLAVKVCVSP